jgi:galactokinase
VASKSWANYVYGVAQILSDQGHEFNGADVAISSEIPRGAGLSSSAALEISFGFALLKLNGLEFDPLALALASQAAEHRFVGTRCGLMDQLTATFAKQDQALLIDCRSLEMHSLPLPIDSETIVVCDSTVKHDLATSAYNDRRADCELGVELLRQRKPGIRALRDLTLADLALLEDLPEPVRRRCRHVVTENDRTLRAAEAIKEGDYSRLGELMRLSHRSLRDDYEVSCEELDLLVNLAERERGVWGARMVGGGFGGCTVNLLKYEALQTFTENVSASYQKATGLTLRLFVIKADSGVREH